MKTIYQDVQKPLSQREEQLLWYVPPRIQQMIANNRKDKDIIEQLKILTENQK